MKTKYPVLSNYSLFSALRSFIMVAFLVFNLMILTQVYMINIITYCFLRHNFISNSKQMTQHVINHYIDSFTSDLKIYLLNQQQFFIDIPEIFVFNDIARMNSASIL